MVLKLFKFTTAFWLAWAILLPTVCRADKNAIKDEQLNLSLNLLKAKTANADGNFVLSPLSIYMATDLLANGAGGKSLEKLLEVILSPKHSLSLTEINQNLSDYMQKLSPAIKINNLVWGNDFKPEYIQAVQNLKAEALDLPESTQTINDWIDEKTNGIIKNLLEVEKTSAGDCYLVNTVYFNDKWTKIFDVKETHIKPFHSLGATQPDDVYMMYNHFPENEYYYENDTFQAVRLWYKFYDGDYPTNYIEFILPKENVDFKQFVNSLTLQDLKIPYDYQKVELKLYLPRFEAEYKTQLNTWFKAYGIPLFKGDNEVDLSALSDIPHYVENIIHQANIRVDEKGTEAAAATAFDMARQAIMMKKHKTPPLKIFNADRPFIYVINGGLFIGAFVKGAKFEAKN